MRTTDNDPDVAVKPLPMARLAVSDHGGLINSNEIESRLWVFDAQRFAERCTEKRPLPARQRCWRGGRGGSNESF